MSMKPSMDYAAEQDSSQFVLPKDEKPVIKVLLVDDDQDCYSAVKRFLKAVTHLTLEVDWEPDFERGLQTANKNQHDVYILDYNLGGKYTGMDLLRQIKSSITDPDSKIRKPVIVLTGFESRLVAVEAIHSHVDDFILKDDLNTDSLKRAILNATEKFNLRNAVENHRIELHIKNAKLEKKNQEIQGFYQTISHELKTPLTSVRELLSIVSDGLAGDTNSEQKELLDMAVDGCDQMTLLINDLLDVSKLETGKFTIHKSPVLIDMVIEKAVLSLRHSANEKGVNLESHLNTDMLRINADEERLLQILTNLLNNAIKFTHQGGNVAVKSFIKHTTNQVVIEVRDNGCGISRQALPYIFDRLYQEESDTETRQKGLGLGLTIVKELVALHNGTISVSSITGKGSTFSIALPLN